MPKPSPKPKCEGCGTTKGVCFYEKAEVDLCLRCARANTKPSPKKPARVTGKPYKTAKTGGDNLGGPALSWWVVLGPGLSRNHFPHRAYALQAARIANEAYQAAMAAERRKK